MVLWPLLESKCVSGYIDLLCCFDTLYAFSCCRWRKAAYPPREYQPIVDYVITSSISASNEATVRQKMQAALPDGFYGPALNCDDVEHTEACKPFELLRFKFARH